ncbi:GNAT family N-acetyltransferase [Aerococcus sp. UMB10185]|uniref:GNAT family N-acetyltransferase n=1 Tax=unclassified Aerococcus TaxID=2618060 RepID=UPI0008A244AA|nr:MULTISPECIES: GNAT family N-acetyltransferase [unclassified Aerococcus]KAB0647345.1 GNAT family N-acetyltransferase [Aerococcus sanguinicola]MDK6233191.1 GNAT family N-acetyltransferase [Aerococcus sp. UMB10185]MDK6856028.1 GNAT family N-acetyltransferase [Aerococcus sp. UMB7533]MDK8502377.1 GNAT family N-acetyltransferase [Aerococcus sp. UMB1112A]OFN00293.1 hypothetical protein HMPREF2626_09430 [Aerococcus sp. HMSC062A02]
MEIYRITDQEWLKAGVYYVRFATDLVAFKDEISLKGEFAEDKPEHSYVLLMENDLPISTCRINWINDYQGKIERVATLPDYWHQGYGHRVIEEAESWIKDTGRQQVVINARRAVLDFYTSLGYVPNFNKVIGSGTFECVYTEKNLRDNS